MRPKILLVPALGLAAFVALAARGQDDGALRRDEAQKPERVSLSVEGHASAPADAVSVELVVHAQAEVGSEAEARHREKLRGVIEALREIEEPNAPFTIDTAEGSSTIYVNGYMSGPNRTRPTSNVQLATAVTCRMKGVSKLSRTKLRRRIIEIVDAAIDAGAELGAPDARLRPAFHFEAADHEALRRSAYEDALARARERATGLGRLAGRELGPIASVSELAWSVRGSRSDFRGPFNPSYPNPNPWPQVAHQQRRADAQGMGALVSPLDELSTNLTEVEMAVTLAVEYELGKVIAK